MTRAAAEELVEAAMQAGASWAREESDPRVWSARRAALTDQVMAAQRADRRARAGQPTMWAC